MNGSRAIVVAAVLGVLAVPDPAQDLDRAEVAALPEVVQRWCADCHGAGAAKGGFALAAAFAADLQQRGEWPGRALQRLRARAMPPADADERPAPADRELLLRAFAAAAPDEPGARVATIRRLTARQYERCVVDLFGVAWPPSLPLPEDVRSHGFDGNGDVDGVTPMQMEGYLVAAAAIADAVLADRTLVARTFPNETPLATALAELLARAFRRPVDAGELGDRLALAERITTAGGDEHAVRRALLQSILASPAFLLRAEAGDPADPAQLTAWELASRLSFATAGTMPDAALRGRAQRGELHRTEVLLAETRRLCATHGGRRLADEFAAQWLRLRDVPSANADFRRYPEIWNHGLRPALYEEVARLFAAIVDEDLSVLTLLDADFTFVDRTLAKLYDLPPPATAGFHRVMLPDRRRGGILGTGAISMLSSFPLRTSPVLRGKYVLEVLLDAATPPPPPNAGTLPPDDAPLRGRSLRAQLERHRRDRGCASCHAQMDPLGFALENFDVLGRWRSDLHGAAIDATGTLPDGTTLDGPITLKDALLARGDDFVRTMAAKLLTFAIGRAMLPADEPELLHIVATSSAAGHRFSALLGAVVTSPLFLRRDPR